MTQLHRLPLARMCRSQSTLPVLGRATSFHPYTFRSPSFFVNLLVSWMLRFRYRFFSIRKLYFTKQISEFKNRLWAASVSVSFSVFGWARKVFVTIEIVLMVSKDLSHYPSQSLVGHWRVFIMMIQPYVVNIDIAFGWWQKVLKTILHDNCCWNWCESLAFQDSYKFKFQVNLPRVLLLSWNDCGLRSTHT